MAYWTVTLSKCSNIGPERLIVQLPSPSPFVLASTLHAFEELINWHAVTERDIHAFLIEHPEFLLSDQYTRLHSELILDRGDKGDLIPDFFAELTTSRFSDIIDLKKPNESLLVGRKDRRGFSAAVHSAVYQLREYRDYFDQTHRREEFYGRFGLRVFKPKIAVVIGRTPSDDFEPELIQARRSLTDAEVITYDDIISRAPPPAHHRSVDSIDPGSSGEWNAGRRRRPDS